MSKIDLKKIRVLVSSKKFIFDYLKKVIKNNNFNYRTFGVDIEPYISSALIEIFNKEGFIKSKKDYILAPDKNYFPDFELKVLQPLAIEYKSGNKVKLSKGKWIVCKNSNNDMGTLNTWLQKIKKFGDKNIYYIFVVYKINDKDKNIIDIQIEPFFRFIGLSKAGLLKYREKDGNLRPKDFDEPSPIKSFKQFKNLFNSTIIYRSKRIIKKHQAILKSVELK